MGKIGFAGGKVGMEAPVIPGVLLGDIAEGGIVKINESRNPVEFYVAKHDYESGLNGAGRTLLVRKDCYDKRVWHSTETSYYPQYATSSIDSWLNGTYRAVLDEEVRSAIRTTTFYYTPGNQNTAVSTLSRAVFLLSLAEHSAHDSTNCNDEGSALPIASSLRTAYLNGSSVLQWTRTPRITSNNGVMCITGTGVWKESATSSNYGSRPCFTLPATVFFDKNTLEFKGVA